MKIGYVFALSAILLASCGESERSEIYNENNTGVINGVVYNINEKPINGLYRTYYQNGNLRMEVYSKNGLPNGAGKFYDDSGNLLYQGTFADGLLEGTLYQYYPEGSVHNEMNYEKGILHGTQKVYNEESEQTVEILYDTGVPISGYVLLDGKKIELTADELAAFKLNENSAATLQQNTEKTD
ncbi:MAG: hypothetical protein IJ099_06010 [Alphaproteobacteria bacterium]|nr:hypothetical protein [Alphaproteobacteria bacterium]